MKILNEKKKLLILSFFLNVCISLFGNSNALGLTKTSFNYLLLDPRITKNLPLNETQDQEQLFKRFVDSIFYIGKGKQTRPHEHLYEAIKLWSRSQEFLKVKKF